MFTHHCLLTRIQAEIVEAEKENSAKQNEVSCEQFGMFTQLFELAIPT